MPFLPNPGPGPSQEGVSLHERAEQMRRAALDALRQRAPVPEGGWPAPIVAAPDVLVLDPERNKR
jgi:hypothetical protein